MYLVYTYDSIIAGLDPQKIDGISAENQQAQSDIIEEGTLEDSLGVNIDRNEDGTIHSQPITLYILHLTIPKLKKPQRQN